MQILREPVVHFALLGVALFALDAVVSDPEPEVTEDAFEVIRVTPEIANELRGSFVAEFNREPTPEELDEQVARWTTEEALRREAIALGLDRNDPIIRRRLVQNMRFVLDPAEAGDEATDAEIDAWIAENMPPAEERARVDFIQVFADRERHEDPRAAAIAIAAELQAGGDPMQVGDPFIRGRNFRGVGRSEIGRVFDEEFADAVLALEPETWSEPLESPFGVHLVQVLERRVPPAAGTDGERFAARRAIERGRAREAEQAATDAVVDRYEVVREDR